MHGTYIYKLTKDAVTEVSLTVIEVSIATRDGWDTVFLDWATLLAKTFHGSLTREDSKELVSRVGAVITEAQRKIEELHEEFRKRIPRDPEEQGREAQARSTES
jgi:hypothetical protein